MKTNELVKKLNAIDGVFAIKQNDRIVISPHDETDYFINIPIDATSFLDLDIFVTSPSLYFAKNVRELVSAIIDEFLTTPIEERSPEKKYRVRLRGFNSDNGHQYLTTKKTDGESRVFACALRTDLKQEFTFDEINKIINRPAFKGTWVLDMIRAGIESVDE